ncbi:restriction endonuclease subunit S [Latilactobacillus sakei]|uniref:restriction endonuclease subunit S n=1 Tax=Latilactobacillus sakei TaxID=1599 RepID=UPI003F53124F
MSKKVPQIRFNGFTDPWEERKLNENVENIGTGRSSFKAGLDYSEQTPYEVLGSTSVISYSDSFDHSGNFVLTARVGANAGNLYKHSGNVKISDNTVYIQSKNLEFIFYLLTKYDLKKLAFGTGQPLIKASELKNLKLFFPKTFGEQQKIGSFFKQLDETIALHQRKLDLLKEQKKGYLQKMFPKNGAKVPELRFAGFADDWEERKLSDIADRFDNLRVPITASDRKPGDTPYYGANGIQDYVEGFTHNGEFILVAEDGANDLKNYPVQYVNGKVWVNNHAHVLQGKKTITDNKFLMNAIKNFNIEPFLVGGGRAKLNADVMMKLNILLPTFDEQEKIGSFFSLLDKTIALHQRKLDLLKEQKKGFLQKMFV